MRKGLLASTAPFHGLTGPSPSLRLEQLGQVLNPPAPPAGTPHIIWPLTGYFYPFFESVRAPIGGVDFIDAALPAAKTAVQYHQDISIIEGLEHCRWYADRLTRNISGLLA